MNKKHLNLAADLASPCLKSVAWCCRPFQRADFQRRGHVSEGKATRGFRRWAERISEIRVGGESFTWSCVTPAGHVEADGTFYPHSASLRPEFCIFSTCCTTTGTLGGRCCALWPRKKTAEHQESMKNQLAFHPRTHNRSD